MTHRGSCDEIDHKVLLPLRNPKVQVEMRAELLARDCALISTRAVRPG